MMDPGPLLNLHCCKLNVSTDSINFTVALAETGVTYL